MLILTNKRLGQITEVNPEIERTVKVSFDYFLYPIPLRQTAKWGTFTSKLRHFNEAL